MSEVFLDEVTVVDADGARGPTDVRLRDGKITEIGALEPGPGATVITGGWVVPGLIDAHAHLSLAPGAAWRPPDAPDALTARRAHHLRATLAAGVTSVLDPAIPLADAVKLEALAAAGPSPRFFYLGPTVSPRGGYVADVIPSFPSVGTADEVAPLFETFAALHPVGVKVTMEDGPLGTIWPLHGDDVRAAVVAESDRRGLPRYLHAMSAPMYEEALTLTPHAFVHGPDRPLPARLEAAVVASEAYVISTLAVPGSALLQWNPEALASPWLAALVPADELATATSPDVQRQWRRAMIDTLAPSVPPALHGVALAVAGNRDAVRARLRHAQAGILALHRAGVPIVVGSDAGNWPILTYLFHGPSTHLELALLVEAGLTPLEALTAATRTPAQMLGQPELGAVAPGYLADLLVLGGDPLADLGELRTPTWVIRAGEARTPADWLSR